MKGKTLLLVTLFVLILFFCLASFWKVFAPTYNAIRYLEGEGYSSVRILQNVPEGRGCGPGDIYRFMFSAIPLEGERRVQGNICRGGAAVSWYED